jgi:histidine triad (HIT) family protein
MVEDCLFCKIVDGEIPSDVVLENEDFIVIKDISPNVPGHSLVIPKKHCKNFFDMPTETYEGLLKTAREAVDILMKEEGAKGFNLLMNSGAVAWQLVDHAHLHILPRREGDGLVLGN